MKPPSRYKPRKRVLSLQELRLVWQDADEIGYPFGTIVKFLIITGRRWGEIVSLTWPQILPKALVFPETKNDQEHVIPYTTIAADILATVPASIAPSCCSLVGMERSHGTGQGRHSTLCASALAFRTSPPRSSHQKIIRSKNRNAKFVLLEGNHEELIERFLDGNPYFEGALRLEHMLKLEERGFEWVKEWSRGEVYKIGKATFTHGLYTNKYHAAKMLDAEAASVFYGHTHDMMCIPRTRRDKADLQVGQSIGCLCQIEQSYMKGKPSNWQQGFAVFFFLPDGTYTYYTPRIVNHRFVSPDGAIYTC